MGGRPIRYNGASGLYSKESMVTVIRSQAERNNLTTVLEDGLVPFEHVRVRDSHESYFFHGCNLYGMDHLEVQEEELLLEVEVIRRSSIALKKLMFREQHASMVLGTFFHFLLFWTLILGSSEYLTTQLDRTLCDFVRVMLFKQCLDLMTTGLDGVIRRRTFLGPILCTICGLLERLFVVLGVATTSLRIDSYMLRHMFRV
jgi:hypothetical protein